MRTDPSALDLNGKQLSNKKARSSVRNLITSMFESPENDKRGLESILDDKGTIMRQLAKGSIRLLQTQELFLFLLIRSC